MLNQGASARPNPSSGAPSKTYDQGGRPEPAYPSSYGQFRIASDHGLAPLRKPVADEFTYRRDPPTNAPPISQQMLPLRQYEDPPGYAPDTRFGVQDPAPSVKVCPPSRPQSMEPEGETPNPSRLQPTALSRPGHDRKGALSQSARTKLISALPRPYMKDLVGKLYDDVLRWVSL